MGLPTVLLQVLIRPLVQFTESVLGEEGRTGLHRRQFPACGLGAVLAKLQRMGMAGLGPGTADTCKTIRLILFQQCA